MKESERNNIFAKAIIYGKISTIGLDALQDPEFQECMDTVMPVEGEELIEFANQCKKALERYCNDNNTSILKLILSNLDFNRLFREFPEIQAVIQKIQTPSLN